MLVQEVDYRSTRLLPGGGVDPGESPTAAASRELMEELGVEEAVDQALAVDWVAPDAAPTPAAMRFPGDLLTVFDGGTWEDGRIAEIRLPPSEITAISFVTPARLPDLLSPTDARRALSALRARINGAGTALLENGRPIAPTVLDRLRVLSTAPPPTTTPGTRAKPRPATTSPRSGPGPSPRTAGFWSFSTRRPVPPCCPAASPNHGTRATRPPPCGASPTKKQPHNSERPS